MQQHISRRNLLLLLVGLDSDPSGLGGITRLQKLLFLLEEEEHLKPTEGGYEFQAFKAGSYSPELYDDLEFLENLGLLKGEVTSEASEPEAEEAVTPWELASRLSYFLWASMPDQAKRRRKIHPLRDALLVGICTFVVSAVGLAIMYLRAHDAQVDAIRAGQLQLARVTAAQLDGDLLKTLSPADQGSPKHLQLLAPMVRMHRASRDIIYVYTGVYRNGRIYWVLDSATLYRIPGDDAPAEGEVRPLDLLHQLRRRRLRAVDEHHGRPAHLAQQADLAQQDHVGGHGLVAPRARHGQAGREVQRRVLEPQPARQAHEAVPVLETQADVPLHRRAFRERVERETWVVETGRLQREAKITKKPVTRFAERP